MWSGQLWQAGLLAAYILLYATAPLFARRYSWVPIPYLALQIIIVFSLLIIGSEYQRDYFAILYLTLSLHVFTLFSQRMSYFWVGLICVIMTVGLIVGYGWTYGGTRFAPTYIGAILFGSLFTVVVRRAVTAREESHRLLAELQDTHSKLQIYVEKIEELTAADERNRLARELHDSVTQTIFSLTLTAEAARILLKKDPSRLEVQLDRIHELAQAALAEMRSLIAQLRPRSVAEEGLVNALQRHVVERKHRDRLDVTFTVDGKERRMAAAAEEALFRIVQEALNNVVKHAQTKQAEISLHMGDELVTLVIEDHGAGFTPTAGGTKISSIGMASMYERVNMLGGVLNVESQPGAGTRIRIDVPLEDEGSGRHG